MKWHPIYQKALKTNKLTQEEAQRFFEDLYAETDQFIKAEFKYYVNRGMWPIKARIPGGAQKDPKFILNHCTGSKIRAYKPALYRFFQAEKASAHFLILDDGSILYLVKLDDMAFHATKRVGVIPFTIAKMLKILDGKWINEPGIEIVGSGNHKLFTPEQFEATIVLQRLIRAYFKNSIDQLKSHRYFSPVDRSGDPGALYFLPLVEHAVLTDVDLTSEDYWLDNYTIDQVQFAKDAEVWMRRLGVHEKDEWAGKRRKLQVTSQMLL